MLGRVVYTVDMDEVLAKKSLGQHWLKDTSTLRGIVEYARLSSSDTVLEIGPGLGTLTSELARKAAQVIAIEYDHSLASALPQLLRQQGLIAETIRADELQGRTLQKSPPSGAGKKILSIKSAAGSDPAKSDYRSSVNVFVVSGDVRRFDLGLLPERYAVVANIPYYLTGETLRLFTESQYPPYSMTLLVQREVAERWAAKPGQMSLSAVAAQLFGHVTLGQVIPAKLFAPPPKVDSQVVRLARYDKPLFVDLDTKQFWRVVKAGFSARRKQLRSSLAGGLHLSKEEIESLLNKAGISPTARAQELSLSHWHALARLLC